MDIKDNKVKYIKIGLNAFGPFFCVLMVTFITRALFVPFYKNYETILVNDVLSGSFLGKPELSRELIFVPVSFILKTLYSLLPTIPWLGIFLFMVNALAMYMMIRSLVKSFDSIKYKILSLIICTILFMVASCQINVFMDYKISFTFLIYAAGAIYITIGSKEDEKICWFDNICGSLMIMLALCTNGTSAQGFMYLSWIAIICVNKMLGHKNKWISHLVPITALSTVAIITAVNVMAYKRLTSVYFDNLNEYWISCIVFVLVLCSSLVVSNLKNRIIDNKKYTKFINICFITGIVLAIALLAFTFKSTNEQYKKTLDDYNKWQDIESYFKNNSDNLYICSEELIEHNIRRAFDSDNSYKNYVKEELGYERVVYRQKLEKEDIDSLKNHLTDNRLYYVALNNNIDGLNELVYNTSVEKDIIPKKSLVLTDEDNVVIYSITVHNDFRSQYYEGNYQSLFLSMFAANDFMGEKIGEFLGENIYSTKETQTYEEMINKLQMAFDVSGDIEKVWIVLDPFNHQMNDLKELTRLIENNREVKFMIMLNFPGMRAWNEKPNRNQIINDYKDVSKELIVYENAYLFAPIASDWILKHGFINDGQKIDYDITSEILGEWIIGYNQVKTDNVDEIYSRVENICDEYKDWDYNILSDERMVCFGDSIIGNYTSASGISMATNSLSGIEVINNCVGGTTASKNFEKAVTLYFKEHQESGAIYVINYGCNEHLQGFDIQGDSGYKNGLIKGIEKIRENDPDARIILMTPFFTDVTAEVVVNDIELMEYVYACISVSKEEDCYCINCYDEMGINKDTIDEYVYSDHVHLNPNGRMKYTEVLVKYILENVK